MATKKTPSTALVPWQQKMAAFAKKQATAEKPVGQFKGISTKSGILSIDDVPVPGNALTGVVLVALHENQYYTTEYEPGVFHPPACYAFGDLEADEPEDSMAPHEEAEDKQGDDNGLCAGCWANAMGSADRGKGKACQNIRKLAIVTEDALESAEALLTADARLLKVPVMSVKGWKQYVRNVLTDQLERPYWAVKTQISIVPDAKSQFRIVFEFVEMIEFDQELFDAMEKKIAEVGKAMQTPYPTEAEAAAQNAAAAPPQRGGRKVVPIKQTPQRPAPKSAAELKKSVPIKTAPVKSASPKRAAKY